MTSSGNRTTGSTTESTGTTGVTAGVTAGATTIGNGITVGIGSLPHRDLDAGIRFALDATSIPTVPSLPKRSPAEGLIVQAMLGIEGVTVGQYGAISVDVNRIEPLAPVTTDLQHDAYAAVARFLELAAERHAFQPLDAVKWQIVGPVTLGGALLRAGVPVQDAYDVAVRAVRSHVQSLLDAVDVALPGVRQLVFIDEPDMVDLTDAHFPIAPDVAIDLVSGALAAIESRGLSGLHVCGDADWPTLMATGPQILSLPVGPSIVEAAGYLQQFLARGGIVAWGAVPTDGPISTTAERPWRELTQLWCQLVERGCDHVLLRSQCIVTPECGLGVHSPSVAERVHRITAEVSRRVHDQATATRFVLGA
jgi:hypothetical protein